jgi:hypothetical protein
MAAAWSREAALSRLQHNRVLQHALQIEPRLQALIAQRCRRHIDLALQPPAPDYARDSLYEVLRLQSHYLVGSGAENLQLRASLYSQALLLALDDLLPPAEWDGARTDAGG